MSFSSSSSRQAQTTNNKWSTINAGLSGLQDTNAVVGSNNNVTTTDFGAIKAAGDFGKAALDSVNHAQEISYGFANNALHFANQSYADAVTQGQNSMNMANTLASQSLQYGQGISDSGKQITTVAVGAIALAGIGMYMVARKGK